MYSAISFATFRESSSGRTKGILRWNAASSTDKFHRPPGQRTLCEIFCWYVTRYKNWVRASRNRRCEIFPTPGGRVEEAIKTPSLFSFHPMKKQFSACIYHLAFWNMWIGYYLLVCAVRRECRLQITESVTEIGSETDWFHFLSRGNLSAV